MNNLKTDLFDPQIGTEQVLPSQVRVDLEVMFKIFMNNLLS